MNARLPASALPLEPQALQSHVDAAWRESIVPELQRYIAVPAKSPMFDPDWAAHGLLERVLANVIDNALRYASESPVRVTASTVGGRVLIAVIDEGDGIARGTEEQLFAPFQRLGDQDTSSGVGLGLSVAKGFVDAMGGTITATDTPGGGLTVLIELGSPREVSAP